MQFRVVLTGDAIVNEPTAAKAWGVVEEVIMDRFKREYDDQRSGLDLEDNDGVFYGLTLRLPGSILVTNLEVQPGGAPGESGVEVIDRPQLRAIRGGGGSVKDQ